MNIQHEEGETDNDQVKRYFHHRDNEETWGQSHGKSSQGKPAKPGDGGQSFNFRDSWSGLKVLYTDILDATDNLSEASVIQEQERWTTYKGKLHGTMVAIKIPDSTSEYFQRMFYQELEVLHGMRHPNVVKLVGACFEAYAIVYEYLPYGDLDDLLKNTSGLLTWERRSHIIYEMCSALIYLHSRGVVHSHVKPCNVFLDVNLQSKLCNFGFSSFLSEKTSIRDMFGHVNRYFLKRDFFRPPSKLYSFEIMILHLLTEMEPRKLIRLMSMIDEKSFCQMIAPAAEKWPIGLGSGLIYWSLKCCNHNENSSDLLVDILARIKTLHIASYQVLYIIQNVINMLIIHIGLLTLGIVLM